MTPESIDKNDRKSARFSPDLPVTVLLFDSLIFWVKKQATSKGHSVQATGTDSDLHPEPQHVFPIANTGTEFSYDGAFVDDIILRVQKPDYDEDEWDILMTEDFEGDFPPVLDLEPSYIPVVMKAAS